MLYYVGLESYVSRYSYQLTEWNTRTFDRLGVEYSLVPGLTDQENDGKITTGQVLDAHKRVLHATMQVQSIAALHGAGKLTSKDTLLFEDMYHPGFDALGYMFSQSGKNRPYIAVRCLAQTIDPDDFVYGKTKIYKWMRHYERMALEIADLVLVASEEMIPNLVIAGYETAKAIAVTGLPFDADEVRSRVPKEALLWGNKRDRVVFASRWDPEKQPDFYCEVADRVRQIRPEVEFAVLAGKPLSSSHDDLLDLPAGHRIKVYDNLSKNAYYEMLSQSKVLFNCALQDWVSNTVSEADALGTNIVFPAYRSFPEALFNDHTRLYVPWSVDDAVAKVLTALDAPAKLQGAVSTYQSKTVLRTLTAIEQGREGKIGKLDTDTYRRKMNHRQWVS